MKTKIIPFDLETAKKIQAGEIEGRIVTNNGYAVRIICFDKRTSSGYPILGLVDYPNQSEMCKAFNVHGLCYGQPVEYVLQIKLPEEVITKEQVSNIFDETYYQSCKNHIEQVYLDMAAEYTGLICNSCDWKGADAQKVIALWIKLNMPNTTCVKESASEYVFIPFDKVLVRNSDEDEWSCSIFSHYSQEDGCYCCNGLRWRQCIPYQNNKHLIGTTDSPK